MANDLVPIESMTAMMAPRIEPMLAPIGLHHAQLRSSFLTACERTPKLLQCTASSLQNAFITSAFLGLMCDGVTGQGFVIPYNVKGSLTATFQIGYKAYPVIGYRGGFTINQTVVREGDEFDYSEGSKAFIHHKRKLGGEADRRIIAAWSQAEKPGFAPIMAILSIDQIMAIKARSQGAKKSDSPWNDPFVGFPAMAAKSASRNMSRMLPILQAQMAGALDAMHDERGRVAYLTESGNMIDGGAVYPETAEPTPPERRIEDRPEPFKLVQANGREEIFGTVEQWSSRILGFIPKLSAEQLATFREKNGTLMAEYHGRPEAADAVMAISMAISKREKELAQ